LWVQANEQYGAKRRAYPRISPRPVLRRLAPPRPIDGAAAVRQSDACAGAISRAPAERATETSLRRCTSSRHRKRS